MTRNHSSSPFLRLPPEIRNRIYGLVLGGNHLWISHSLSELDFRKPEEKTTSEGAPCEHSGQWFHQGGKFHHRTVERLTIGGYEKDYGYCVRHRDHLGLLRICRQIYTEAALLPYTLNTFTFAKDSVRRSFEQSARPGMKKAQKKAVGKYAIGSWFEFLDWHRR